MKALLFPLLLLLAALSAQAQPLDAAVERDRIRAERAAADARFAGEEKACYGKFAVNDCIARARRERNEALGELRRQERVLDEADRRRQAAERQKELDERASAERQREADERRARAQAEQKAREERAAGKAARRAADQAERAAHPRVPGEAPTGAVPPQGKPRAAREPKGPALDPAQAERNRQAHEARLQEAARHKAEVLERAARRSKPAASDLPAPP